MTDSLWFGDCALSLSIPFLVSLPTVVFPLLPPFRSHLASHLPTVVLWLVLLISSLIYYLIGPLHRPLRASWFVFRLVACDHLSFSTDCFVVTAARQTLKRPISPSESQPGPSAKRTAPVYTITADDPGFIFNSLQLERSELVNPKLNLGSEFID